MERIQDFRERILPADVLRMRANAFIHPGHWSCTVTAMPEGVVSEVITVGGR